MTAAQGAGLSDEIVALLTEHDPNGFSCACGWRNEAALYHSAHRAHVAEHLARRERAAVAAALTTAAEAIEAEASEAARSWGDDAMWLTTGTNVAEVSSDYFAETVRDLIPQEES